MQVRIELTPEEGERLIDLAVRRRRSVARQAEWLVLTALGLRVSDGCQTASDVPKNGVIPRVS